MPELPEVETVKRYLEPDLIGQTIRCSQLFWPKTLQYPSLTELNSHIENQNIVGLQRRGKYLIICLDQGYLVFHLRMTGRMYCCDRIEGLDPWVRWSMTFHSRQVLCFSDARKFGRVFLTQNLVELNSKLGPEPLDMGPDQWAQLFKDQTAGLKAFLLNQKKIAGIGNIYADEALFQAGLHPLTPAGNLTTQQAKTLGVTLQTRLQAAIQHEGSTISWYRKPDGSQGESQKHFNVYGRAGKPCINCQKNLQKIQVAQRSTVFCPYCQQPPKWLRTGCHK